MSKYLFNCWSYRSCEYQYTGYETNVLVWRGKDNVMNMLEGRVARYERNEMHCICSTAGLIDHVNTNILDTKPMF